MFLANFGAHLMLEPLCMSIGCAAGCRFTFFSGERFARKNTIIVGGTTMMIGALLLGPSTTLAQLLLGRIVTGLGKLIK
jgi:MFS family permease